MNVKDIAAAHRVPSNRGNSTIPALFVKMIYEHQRHMVLRNKKQLATKDDWKGVRIEETITSARANLMRYMINDERFDWVWTQHGKLWFVFKDETEELPLRAGETRRRKKAHSIGRFDLDHTELESVLTSSEITHWFDAALGMPDCNRQ